MIGHDAPAVGHPDPAAGPARRRPGWRLPSVALAIGLLLLVAGIGVLSEGYDRIQYEDGVMSGSLQARSQLLIKLRGDDEPHRGDIVVFDGASWTPDRFGPKFRVLRVIGVGGDRVACCDDRGRIQVNGRAINEDYVRLDAPIGTDAVVTLPFEATVPAGRVFLLGDWRANSADSRTFLEIENGTLPLSAIQGRVVATYELIRPPTRVPTTSAFADVGYPSSTVDNWAGYAWWAAAIGLVVSILGFLWVITVAILRTVRPVGRPAVGAG